ncbi:Maf-like protein [Histomonas meleagridis]|uniref:Maf-like protein n=1 Tax=Histomonas meleagridis TaxID=135588 RepID=UPI00355A4F79|nr:Maf-like protein [Histomonas meleagridis]KAH0796558.1 Maf-like protein [Histomonas meleagridis]
MEKIRVILGSSSKWRRELAKKYLGCESDLMAADIDEKKIAREAKPKTIQDHPLVIAKAKLSHLLGKVNDPKTLILCYDTIVVCNGKILEKPDSEEECISMIKMWAKKDEIIEVYTAIAIGLTEPRIEKFDVQRADIKMTRDFTDEDVQTYIQKSNSMCITSSGAVIVEDLIDMNSAVISSGEMSVIEGLPIEGTKQIINEILKQIK